MSLGGEVCVREEARMRVVEVVSSWVLIAFFFFGNTKKRHMSVSHKKITRR
jgi:hypothetical protein